MVFKKAIIQVYSRNNQFSFDDFVKGTLRLLNYATDRNIDLKINISGSEIEKYTTVSNYNYDNINITPKVYFNGIDNLLLINNLDTFVMSTERIFVITSNVSLDRCDIYNSSYLTFDKLLRYNDELYNAADSKVMANILTRNNSDNLKYGYNIIYIDKDDRYFKTTVRYIYSLANQIRSSINMNHDTMVLSNSIQLRKIVSEYIVMSSLAVKTIDDSDIDIGPTMSIPDIREVMIDYIILLNARKIYRFSHTMVSSPHTISKYLIKNKATELYEVALNTNGIIWNLKKSDIPLYYQTHTIVGSPLDLDSSGVCVDSSGVRLDSSGICVDSSGVCVDSSGVCVDSSGVFPNPHISLLSNPSGVAQDNMGNLYITDTLHHRILKLDSSNNLHIVAGTDSSGYTDGMYNIAQFNNPTAIAIDKNNNIYIADTGNNAIRMIQWNIIYTLNGDIAGEYYIVSTVIGANILPVTLHGIGSATTLNGPRGVAVDTHGNLYIADTGNHRICKVVSLIHLTTVAGITTSQEAPTYIPGYINGSRGEASFNTPTGITLDTLGNIYVADTGNNVIRKIDVGGVVTTVAGNAQPFFKDGPVKYASFNKPTGVAIDLKGVIYVSDTGNNSIRSIHPTGIVSIVVGSPTQISGSIDGYGDVDPLNSVVPFLKRATFRGPTSILVDFFRNIYVADTLNNTVRRIQPTFSSPTNIRPIPIQSFKIINAPGVASALGPTLSQPPNTQVVQGHRRGRG